MLRWLVEIASSLGRGLRDVSQGETWLDRQHDVLVGLRKDREKQQGRRFTQSDAARLCNIDLDLYRRLEARKQQAKSDEVIALATGYCIEPGVLLLKLRPLSDAPAYSPRAEMEASGDVPADTIARVSAQLEGQPEDDQRAIVQNTIAHFRKQREQTGAG